MRSGGGPNSVAGGSAAGAAPRRGHYVILACLPTLVAIYGSWVPLHFEPLGVGEAIRRFAMVLDAPLSWDSLSDWAANVLLFVPISYFWLAAAVVDRRSLKATLSAAAALIPALLLFSFVLEFTQLWFPPRTPISSDIVAQTMGSLIGIGLWMAVGQALTDWIRSYRLGRRRGTPLEWLLQAYLVAFLIHSLMPLDLTISVTQLAHKYREGRVLLVPFSHFQWDWASFAQVLAGAGAFVPIGLLAATWLTPGHRPVRSAGAALVLGMAVVVGVELGQMLVYSHLVDTSDLITGTVGVVVGIALARRWTTEAGAVAAGGGSEPTGVAAGPAGRGASGVKRGSSARGWLSLGLALGYSLVLVYMMCAPLDLTRDLSELKARYQGFFRLTFLRLYSASPQDLLFDTVKKTLFFAPLGGLLAMAVTAWPLPPPIRRLFLVLAVLAAAAVGLFIEMLQVFSATHGPDFTDVVVYTMGAAFGAIVATWLSRPPDDADRRQASAGRQHS